MKKGRHIAALIAALLAAATAILGPEAVNSVSSAVRSVEASRSYIDN